MIAIHPFYRLLDDRSFRLAHNYQKYLQTDSCPYYI